MLILPIRRLVAVVVIIFFGHASAMAQTEMTKDEILVAWKSIHNKDINLSFKDFRALDSANKTSVNKTIDSLLSGGIDSFIIYTAYYPGYMSSNECYKVGVMDSYIIWQSATGMRVKTIKGICESELVNSNLLKIFNYCTRNIDVIQKEVVMPVLLSGELKSDSVYVFKSQIITHEPNYSLAIALGNTFKLIRFTENDLQNKDSIFHDYNRELRSIRLWELINSMLKVN